MHKPVNFNFILILIILLAGVFYFSVWKDAPFVAGDTPDYVDAGTDIQDGSYDVFHSRTPGYPLLLVLTNSLSPTRTLFVVQMAMYFTAVLFLASFFNAEGVPIKFILLFLFLSLIPQSVANTVYMLTETFTIFSIVTGVVALFWFIKNGKWYFALLSGAAFAFSAIIRPTYQLLIIVLIGILFVFGYYNHEIKKKLLLGVGSLLLFWALILGGFSWFNYSKFGYFGLSPVVGFNLSTKTSRVIERLPDEYAEVRELLITFRDHTLTERDGFHTGEEYIWSALPALRELTKLNDVNLSKYMLKINLLLIKKAPLNYVQEVCRALSTYWLPTSTEHTNFNSELVQMAYAVIHFIIVAVFFGVSMLIFSLLILIFILPKGIKDDLLALAKPYNSLMLPFFMSTSIIVYSMLVTVAVETGNPRHRTPTDMLMFFSMTLGIYFLSRIRAS